jgi:hypothetical protein
MGDLQGLNFLSTTPAKTPAEHGSGRLRESGVHSEGDWLHCMSPVHFGHINFRGTMHFGAEKFSQSLLRENSGEAASFKLR